MTSVKHRKAKIIAYSLIVVGEVCLLYALTIHVDQPKPPQISSFIKSVDVVQAQSSLKPSSIAVSSYNVAPTLPKYIDIPAIGVSQSRVIQLGLLANNQISVPNNIYDTGWYNASSKPGQPGAMFIYGHVSNWTANGVFYNLKELKPSDTIIITRGDNQTYTYQVVSMKVYPSNNVDMTAVLSPINSNEPGLNLMTCTGQVIKGTSDFSERLVVFTSLVKN